MQQTLLLACAFPVSNSCATTQRFSESERKKIFEEVKMLEADSPTINVLCEKHDMKLDFFCSSHKEPCCVKCISRDHSDCPPISSESLENIVKNANPSSYVQELEESLCSVIEIVNILKQDQQQNNENIKKQRQKLESEVKEFKKSMISSLDVLEKKLFESISKSSDRCKNEITESYNELEALTNQCTGIKDNLSNMKQFATDLHMFLGTISLQKKLDAIRCSMSGTEDRLRNCEMKFARDLDIKPFESCIEKFSETHITCKTHNDYRSKLTHAETFPKKSRIVQQSKINAKEWTTTSVSGGKSKSLGAKDSEQVYNRTSRVTESTRFSSSTELTLQQKFVTESTDHVNVNGCAILSNGELVFTEYVNKCLVVYQGNGVKSRVIELFDSPWDVCEVANKTVALNFPVRSTIMVIEISSSKGKVMESFSTSAGICTAITYNDPNLIVAIQKVGFQIFDLKGKLIKTIEMKFHDAKYIAFHSSRLFYTNWKKNEVVCCDLEQKINWKFKRSDLKCPSGICVDYEGNILVVGTSSGNILKIKPDGKSAEEILRTEGVFDSPIGISLGNKKGWF